MPKKDKISRLIDIILNRELAKEVEEELWTYAKFFAKRELIQPETSQAKEDIAGLASLLMDLQVSRERVTVIFLETKKAYTRLKDLEKEYLSLPKMREEYFALKNNEQRELYVYSIFKPLPKALSRAGLLMEMAEKIMESLDKHTYAVKENMYSLRPLLYSKGSFK